MKKVLAVLCSLSLVLAFGTTAFAADDNLAVGKTAIAYTDVINDQAQGTGTLPEGIDGNAETRWASPANTVTDGKFEEEVWYGVNLGEQMSFDKIVIDWEQARAKPAADGYVIQASNDGSTWKTLDAKYEYGMKPEDANMQHSIDTITFDAVKAQYVRVMMYAPKASDKNSPSIYEFEVYNAGGKDGVALDDAQQGEEKPEPSTPTTGVEFPMAMAVVAVAAAACVGMTMVAKKAR